MASIATVADLVEKFAMRLKTGSQLKFVWQLIEKTTRKVKNNYVQLKEREEMGFQMYNRPLPPCVYGDKSEDKITRKSYMDLNERRH